MSCWQMKCCGKDILDCGWCARHPNQACGWPPKTVRSILAVIVITIAILASLVTIVFLDIKHKWEISVGLLGGLLSIGSGILGYYFGYRSGSKEPIQANVGSSA